MKLGTSQAIAGIAVWFARHLSAVGAEPVTPRLRVPEAISLDLSPTDSAEHFFDVLPGVLAAPEQPTATYRTPYPAACQSCRPSPLLLEFGWPDVVALHLGLDCGADERGAPHGGGSAARIGVQRRGPRGRIGGLACPADGQLGQSLEGTPSQGREQPWRRS